MGKTEGLSRLQRKLGALPKELRSAVRQALAESADDMVGMMKNLAPVSPSGQRGWPPGMLRESIVATFGDGSAPKYAAFRRRNGRRGNAVKSNDPDLSVTITAGNETVRYAHLVEFGTKPHVNKGKFAGTMHPGTQAQPFFYPSYRAQVRPAKRRITRAIGRAARSIAKGGGNGA